LAALVFSDVRSAARWFVAWAGVFLGSGIAGELLGGVSPAVPEWFTSTMLALNVTVGGAIFFTLLAVFAGQRRDALAALRVEQEKAENLLLNVLPESIAERLKVETRTIADHFSSASILFADVLWGAAVTPAARVDSYGSSGRIQITRATKELLAEEFVCGPSGTIPVKGKGEIEAWYLVRRRGDPTGMEPPETLARLPG